MENFPISFQREAACWEIWSLFGCANRTTPKIHSVQPSAPADIVTSQEAAFLLLTAPLSERK